MVHMQCYQCVGVSTDTASGCGHIIVLVAHHALFLSPGLCHDHALFHDPTILQGYAIV